MSGTASAGPRCCVEFEGADAPSWPSSTSTLCFWCCHAFPGTPVGLPIKYREDTGTFDTVMCFCSLECAAAHVISHYDDNTMYEALQNVNAMARRAGMRIPVHPSPRRETMK